MSYLEQSSLSSPCSQCWHRICAWLLHRIRRFGLPRVPSSCLPAACAWPVSRRMCARPCVHCVKTEWRVEERIGVGDEGIATRRRRVMSRERTSDAYWGGERRGGPDVACSLASRLGLGKSIPPLVAVIWKYAGPNQWANWDFSFNDSLCPPPHLVLTPADVGCLEAFKFGMIQFGPSEDASIREAGNLGWHQLLYVSIVSFLRCGYMTETQFLRHIRWSASCCCCSSVRQCHGYNSVLSAPFSAQAC